MAEPTEVYCIPSDSDEDAAMLGKAYTAIVEPPWMTNLLSDALRNGPELPSPPAPIPSDFSSDESTATNGIRKRARPGENGNPRGVNHFFTFEDKDDILADFELNSEKRNAMFPFTENMQYMEYVLERGGFGNRLHVHCFVRTIERMAFTRLKREFPAVMQSFHYGGSEGVVYGSPEDMLKYIRKHDNTWVAGPWTRGAPLAPAQHQGHRSDFDAAVETLKRTGDLRAVAELHTKTCVRYAGGFERTAALLKPVPPVERPMRVICLWGPTRQGKTTLAYKLCTQMFEATPYEPPRANDGQAEHLFDMYEGQKCLFLDEFDWRKWDINFLKKILDKFRLQLTCRYRNLFAAWELVVICANSSPTTWWTGPEVLKKNSSEDIRAIFARLGGCFHKVNREQDLEDCEVDPRFSTEDGTLIPSAGIF